MSRCRGNLYGFRDRLTIATAVLMTTDGPAGKEGFEFGYLARPVKIN